ncbi:MAG: hypothetical protein AAFW84_18365 [Cyanobacteria bacterium J06635_15]
MSVQPVQNCQRDDLPLMGLKECMETYGVSEAPKGKVDPNDPHQEWTNNCLSTRTVAYTCGRLCRDGDTVVHNHDPAEIDRCQQIALEAAGLMDGIEVGMGTEASDVFFYPFFVTANLDQPIATDLTESVIRSAFGGTIYPPAKILISPLVEKGRWWELLDEDYEGYPEALVTGDTETLEEFNPDEQAEFNEGVQVWQSLINWFNQHDDLRSVSLVEIGDGMLSNYNLGCVFPRLIVGLTKAGSLAGLAGYVVYT